MRDRKHTPRKAKPQKPQPPPWYFMKPLIGDLVERHADDRGTFVTVENVASFKHPIGAVAILTSKAGTVRAEHRHKNEGHTCILVTGSAVYHERNATGRIAPIPMVPFVPVFTPPDVDHAFEFTADSIMVVIANISRTQAEYEADVTRLTGDDRLVQPKPLGEAPIEVKDVPPGTVMGSP